MLCVQFSEELTKLGGKDGSLWNSRQSKARDKLSLGQMTADFALEESGSLLF